MKMAFCLFRFFPYGGMQRDFLRIALACRDRGHTPHVFTMDWEGDVPSGFDVSIIPARGLTNHARCRDYAIRVLPRLHAGQFDVTVGFNKIPGLDVYFAADPCYKAWALEHRGLAYRLGRRYRTYVTLENAVFSPSAKTEVLLLVESERQKFVDCYGTSPERFHVVPPGITCHDTSVQILEAAGTAVRQELHVADGGHLVLAVGSSFRTKGLDRSLHALARLPDGLRAKTHFAVIGRGNVQPYERLARRLGLAERVHFLGERDDVPRLLSAADLLLHPARMEAAGMVLLEAMVAGVPILVTDVCGYAYHVTKADAGRLIGSPFQQCRLDAALAEMLTSPRKAEWRRNGLEYAAHTDISSLPEKAVEVIESVAA